MQIGNEMKDVTIKTQGVKDFCFDKNTVQILVPRHLLRVQKCTWRTLAICLPYLPYSECIKKNCRYLYKAARSKEHAS